MRSLLLAACLLSVASGSAVVKLTEENFHEMTNDKTVFLKMFAPWCGHCKSMAADWEKLAEDWKDSTGLIGEVDCTDPASEHICEQFNVEGFPTLLYGDPSAPDDYQGARDYDSLSQFAKTFLHKPVCTVTNEDACDDEQKKLIADLKSKSKDELMATVKDIETKVQAYQNDLNDFIDEINEQYDLKTDEFNSKIQSLHSESNYKWLQQVLSKVHGVKPTRPDRDGMDGLNDDAIGAEL
ncbi:hypothetical protein MPSEU_000800500 [Mayamaea pseudoterrestris]|nr:hypothetical protein MPSEU_000800500 [Mayamaea pseudoterrestris]